MKHVSELRLADLYRSRQGWVLGVCKGLATFLGVPVFWVRVLVLLLTPCTGVWPMVGGYLLAAFLIRPEPALAPDNAEERAFYDEYVASRPHTLQRLRRRCDRLARRVGRLENWIAAREATPPRGGRP